MKVVKRIYFRYWRVFDSLSWRSLPENRRISSRQARNKAHRRCVLRVSPYYSLFFFLLPLYFALRLLLSSLNTCCTRHRGREIDFVAADIRWQEVPAIFHDACARFSLYRWASLQTILSHSLSSLARFENHTTTSNFRAVSAFSDYLRRVGRGVDENSTEIASPKPDNAIILASPLLRMKRSGIELPQLAKRPTSPMFNQFLRLDFCLRGCDIFSGRIKL